MPFVLFLLFGGILFLMCASSKGSYIMRMNNFPSCRYQEELLLFYEKFFEYRQDPSRTDPVGDALEDARYELWKQGHLPTSFIAFGMSDWKHRPVARRQRFTRGIKIRVIPFYSDLLKMREFDRRTGEQNMSGEYLERRGKDVVFNQERWDAYCSELDRRFDRLWNKPQLPFDYSIVDNLDEHDAHSVLYQEGNLCYHNKTGWWTANVSGKFLGFASPSVRSRVIPANRNITKKIDEATDCTYYYLKNWSLEKQKRVSEEWFGESFSIASPITISASRFNG